VACRGIDDIGRCAVDRKTRKVEGLCEHVAVDGDGKELAEARYPHIAGVQNGLLQIGCRALVVVALRRDIDRGLVGLRSGKSAGSADAGQAKHCGQGRPWDSGIHTGLHF
jgi:hypothetical protein